MATFLDITALQGFTNVFVFLFVWVVVFAGLGLTRVLGDNKSIHILISFLFAMFTLFSPTVIDVIQFIAPWIGIVFLFGIFATAGFKYLGGTEGDNLGGVKVVTLVMLIVIVVVGGLAKIRENVESPGDEDGDDDFDEPFDVLLHPKILGAAFIFILAIFTIVLLAGKQYM